MRGDKYFFSALLLAAALFARGSKAQEAAAPPAAEKSAETSKAPAPAAPAAPAETKSAAPEAPAALEKPSAAPAEKPAASEKSAPAEKPAAPKKPKPSAASKKPPLPEFSMPEEDEWENGKKKASKKKPAKKRKPKKRKAKKRKPKKKSSNKRPPPKPAKTIKNEKYIMGGLAAVAPGFGAGHAVQGRYFERGWIFTVSELTALYGWLQAYSYGGLDPFAPFIRLKGKITRESAEDQDAAVFKTLQYVFLAVFAGFKAWEMADAWILPSHYKKIRAESSLKLAPYAFQSRRDMSLGMALSYKF